MLNRGAIATLQELAQLRSATPVEPPNVHHYVRLARAERAAFARHAPRARARNRGTDPDRAERVRPEADEHLLRKERAEQVDVKVWVPLPIVAARPLQKPKVTHHAREIGPFDLCDQAA